ncbi:ribosomal protein YmL35 [Microdochium trichocladiopsis]|uniref:Large ribosomal subunit protein mL38 n=1 Tax=Microdochium trichocladiopsis TaxID=1682393 RepID=A0A9P9BVH8_9PEZI|nr:ribosomal protein YmL35 [Microdochium trichocladiopsis]KAH7033357.1 ribosomal protein YmL35 [Microdochium trichocladiopsis]
MASCQRVARPALRSVHQAQLCVRSSRPFTQTSTQSDNVETTTKTALVPERAAQGSTATSPSKGDAQAAKADTVSATKALLDRNTTTAGWAEKRLYQKGTHPIGSRRRRAAIRTSENVPFEQLPYQCFQEARKILQADRAEKIKAIAAELDKIKRLEEVPAEKYNGGQAKKNLRLTSLRKHVEELKILADINDPLVKRKFEDGLGDMSKPIYRHLAELKWRGMPYKIITQRIEQFNIVPDVLPKFEPTMDVQLYFRRVKVEPGDIINSLVSEVPPRLRVQAFDKGERLVSVVVMDSDVPNAETDSFDRRCHYLAANIPLSPTQQSLPLGQVNKETQLAVPWLPAFSQKGAPYHRMSVFILEQKPGEALDIAKLRELYATRDGFSLKSFRDKFSLTPVGFNLFRSVWDENTAAVMERAGMPGADIEFKHKRVYSLKGEKKQRGWEAKRQKPKYRSLWKYSKRIHGLKNGRR